MEKAKGVRVYFGKDGEQKIMTLIIDGKVCEYPLSSWKQIKEIEKLFSELCKDFDKLVEGLEKGLSG